MIKQQLKEGVVGGKLRPLSRGGPKPFSQKKMMKESYLSKFIFAVCNKNYKQADKYLSEEINARLKARISSHI